MQQDRPEDFVIATRKQISVREFVRLSARELGMELDFQGKAIDEVAIVSSIDGDLVPALSVGDLVVRVDPRYYRPAEVETLLGDPSKAKKILGWEPEISVEEMCSEMISYDLEQAKQKALLKSHGYDVSLARED